MDNLIPLTEEQRDGVIRMAMLDNKSKNIYGFSLPNAVYPEDVFIIRRCITVVAEVQTRVFFSEPNVQMCDPLIEQIKGIAGNDDMYDEDEPRPNCATIERAEEVIKRFLPIIRGGSLPEPVVFPFNGSIRIEWRRGRKLLSITIPSSPSVDPYLYHLSENPGSIQNPSAATLETWLEWLAREYSQHA